MALELKKTKIAKTPGAKATLGQPDILAGLGGGAEGLLGEDGVPCLEGFLGGRDGFFVSDGLVDVGAVSNNIIMIPNSRLASECIIIFTTIIIIIIIDMMIIMIMSIITTRPGKVINS